MVAQVDKQHAAMVADGDPHQPEDATSVPMSLALSAPQVWLR